MYSQNVLSPTVIRHIQHKWWRCVYRLSVSNWKSKVKSQEVPLSPLTRQSHTDAKFVSERHKDTVRTNEIGIQMLSPNIHHQIFGKEETQNGGVGCVDDKTLQVIKKHLSAHDLWDRESTVLPDVNFTLPPLQGKNIAEHLYNVAQTQVQGYLSLANLMMAPNSPPKPTEWAMTPGWTRYSRSTGTTLKVDYPEENILVFDVEVLVSEGNYPTMATAMSHKHWYSWCSDLVLKDRYRWTKQPLLSDLIPLEAGPSTGQSCKDQPQRLVIGHNVGFDRSYVQEQYHIQKSRLRFLDTMSMHIAVCGLTSYQRILYQASKKDSNRKEVREHEARTRYIQADDEWKMISTLNNLKDVHKLHVGGEALQKDIREVFMKGTMEDVRSQFQMLMNYCADDVLATTDVFRVLYPEFRERFPHPVTFSGMMEMGTSYLPINQNWERYIHESESVYHDLQRELKSLLMKLADESCRLLHNEEYKSDPWLWDLDWQVANIRMKAEKKLTKKQLKEQMEKGPDNIEEIIATTYATKDRIPKNASHAPGYPNWYRALIPKKSAADWKAGPSLISTLTRVTPKLMRLTWDGYPLHYSDKYGWGYLIPDQDKAAEDMSSTNSIVESKTGAKFPMDSVFKLCGLSAPGDQVVSINGSEFDSVMDTAMKDAAVHTEWPERARHMDKAHIKRERRSWVIKNQSGSNMEPMADEKIPGCHFIPLPHKNGKGNRVGNPLARDFISKMEGGILKAMSGTSAQRILTLSSMCSYWKNNIKRIESQMAIRLGKDDLPSTITTHNDYDENSFHGAIVPRIVPAGTITRRAVEPTWLTASNAYPDRVGSELKAMVQSPPGYKFVGADVDSEELWIAAIIGDSHAKIHGCTAFGWMNLQGKKSDKTDLHSKTADTVGISRDHAKIFNYGRIYGAGKTFAQRLLMQFNHRLTETEATEKANIMYKTTKGKRKTVLFEDTNGLLHYKSMWTEGSESEMFNQLEAIATAEHPSTPVLGSSISKALEPQYVGNDFMTSRINWVVQSSAVDYLHLMLVCMQWLIEEYDIDMRFSISIHDEVRYLVSEKDKYRAALALQITNLLTRSIFAYKLGMCDLPRSVAFFSAVDIDTCIRKEVNMDCRTPSNPRGMEMGYGVTHGEALDILEILDKTNGGKFMLDVAAS